MGIFKILEFFKDDIKKRPVLFLLLVVVSGNLGLNWKTYEQDNINILKNAKNININRELLIESSNNFIIKQKYKLMKNNSDVKPNDIEYAVGLCSSQIKNDLTACNDFIKYLSIQK